MLQALEAARRGQAAVLGPPWRGDYIYSRDVAAGLAGLIGAPALPRTVYNLGGGRAETVETWCAALAGAVPGFSWRRAEPGEPYTIESHTGFNRGAMDIGKIASSTGYRPRFDMESAAQDWLAWA